MRTDKTSATINIYKRDYGNCDKENVGHDLLNIEWNQVKWIEIHNPNESSNLFCDKIDYWSINIFPWEKLTRKESKNMFKPWITSGIWNSMKRETRCVKNLLKQNNLILSRNMSHNIKHLEIKL